MSSFECADCQPIIRTPVLLILFYPLFAAWRPGNKSTIMSERMQIQRRVPNFIFTTNYLFGGM
jgi:hypothetical protein